MESWKSKFPKLYKSSRRSKPAINGPCKKHPKHIQSPGVCSICLTEKLSHLLSNPVNIRSSSKPVRSPSSSTSSSSYDLSSLSSSNASSCSSPVVIYTRRDGRKYSVRVLKKSRSMAAFVPTRRKQEDGSKRGFWSKLLPGNRGLTHSRTMRERVVTIVG
ncbi:hypothetical protein CDL12_17289 [Handroanthus impetiginosus]|uniref:Uncharacterized protein n=1 Tax=Handroanthus impetiginosus TaxID=429701 RepID=A0A2G9GXX0_9LAMI|nr:hypothetical protein CDL12_17289 [Handroanthus impetiginosus]